MIHSSVKVQLTTWVGKEGASFRPEPRLCQSSHSSGHSERLGDATEVVAVEAQRMDKLYPFEVYCSALSHVARSLVLI